MTLADLFVLLPLLVMAAAVIIILVVIAFYRHHRLTVGLALAGLAAAMATLPLVWPAAPRPVTGLLLVDAYGLFYMGLLMAATLAVVLLAYGYLGGRQGDYEELYLLLLLATVGAMVLVVSSHFAALFLGLEILSVSLYVLIAYLRTRRRSIEAGIKYLVLAAVSSAFLLFGMALVYARLGTMELAQVTEALARTTTSDLLLLSGLALMMVGVGFKLAVVPFHMWTPDVYEGASAPVTAFVATVSKGGMFALLVRYFAWVDNQALFWIFGLVAVASMFGGNLLALLQNNVKRILAYSSIAHLGYLLVAFLAGGSLAVTAVSYYLVAYFATTVGAFGLVALLSDGEQEAESMAHYRSLFWRRPWLAAAFTIILLSLAGIPLTAGFIGKFYVVTAGVGSALWALVIILVANSAIGLYYYLRLVVMMGLKMPPPDEKEKVTTAPSLPLAGRLVLGVMVLLIVGLGVYPTRLIELIMGLG